MIENITIKELRNVEKPARYVGGEINQVIKEESTKCKVAFCFPDTYEIGMSNLGLKVLYNCINNQEDMCCERVFAPWPDFEKLLRDKNKKLYSLETKKDIDKFDVIAFTLQYEMSYTNILNMLNLAGVPIKKVKRKESFPFVIAGGSCTVNPAPLEKFIDIFLIGEGETVIVEILNKYIEWKDSNLKKEDYYNMIKDIEGVYIPSIHRTEKIKVRKTIINKLDDALYPTHPVVPNTEVVHDRVSLEIFRGCQRGCRFCQAGYIYRPVRERSIDNILSLAKESLDNQGYNEITISSLSTADYSNFIPLAENLLDMCGKKNINVSLPSLRIDSMNLEVLKNIQQERKSSLTFAPEAGSERLRAVINKNLTKEQILESSKLAFENGWRKLKLYFMIGLPTENYEDLDAIINMTEDIVEIYRQLPNSKKKGRCKITVSVGSFVPKSHTPFQWCGQNTLQKLETKQHYLKNKKRSQEIKLELHDVKVSIIEALLAKGNENVGDTIYEAWKLGAKFDAWNEFFNLNIWNASIIKTKINLEQIINDNIALDAPLTWDNIDVGVSKEYLKKEYLKAIEQGITTKRCKEKCSGCGINKSYGCEFVVEKRIKLYKKS